LHNAGAKEPHLRILVVEDEPANQELMRAIIESSSASFLEGAEVVIADSLAAAREALARFDIVLLDIGLPDGDGLDLVKELGTGARPRTVVVSGSVFPIERRAALATGADEFIAKPIETANLITTIRAVMQRRTLLVVEDYADLREMIYEALTAYGYRVLLAADGLAALELAQAESGHIDLVLTDYYMPNMLGTEFAERLREQHPYMRVIFMSGSPLPSGQSGVGVGQTVLQKPFMVEELLTTVQRIFSETAEK
jgi:CheY-like chemotaxis protein